jgi:hypothetical protein
MKADGQVPKRRMYEIYLRQWAVPNIMLEIVKNIIIMTLQHFVGLWPLFQFLDPIHSR